MTYTEKLINRLPKKHIHKVQKLETADGLIDDCKFLLYFNAPYAWQDYYCVPVKSITEAVNFVKEAEISGYELHILESEIEQILATI